MDCTPSQGGDSDQDLVVLPAHLVVVVAAIAVLMAEAVALAPVTSAVFLTAVHLARGTARRGSRRGARRGARRGSWGLRAVLSRDEGVERLAGSVDELGCQRGEVFGERMYCEARRLLVEELAHRMGG